MVATITNLHHCNDAKACSPDAYTELIRRRGSTPPKYTADASKYAFEAI